MQNSIPVLSTRPLNPALIKKAVALNIQIDELSFIETVPVENIEVQQEIENAVILSAMVVFTSMNAVEAVSGFLEIDKPDWKIYCIGNTTRELVSSVFGEELIAGTAVNATDLAELIIEEYEDGP